MMHNVPSNLLFTKEHEWITKNQQVATIGITDHAQSCLGDVVYVELPEKGSIVEKGKPIGVVESVKAVSDIYAPATGKVLEINQKAIDDPSLINTEPYENGWLLKIELLKAEETSDLLSDADYEELLLLESK